jgi:hypothetical protein
MTATTHALFVENPGDTISAPDCRKMDQMICFDCEDAIWILCVYGKPHLKTDHIYKLAIFRPEQGRNRDAPLYLHRDGPDSSHGGFCLVHEALSIGDTATKPVEVSERASERVRLKDISRSKRKPTLLGVSVGLVFIAW